MMKFNIYILQKKAEPVYQQAMDEYLKRLQAYGNVSVNYIKNDKQMKKNVEKGGKKFLVVPGKKSKTSPEFAETIKDLSVQGESELNFYIGNIYEPLEQLNISSFSMNTSLTVVVLLEQIYRAYRIINNQPYHK